MSTLLADASVLQDSIEAGKPWYPTPELNNLQKATIMANFYTLHDVNVGEYDQRCDQQPGHIVLRWNEPKLGLGVVAVLTRDYLTADIARAERRGTSQNLHLLQRASTTNRHRFACQSLKHALEEIRDYRAGERLAGQLKRLKGQKKSAESRR